MIKAMHITQDTGLNGIILIRPAAIPMVDAKANL
jgi:hypothetical protein